MQKTLIVLHPLFFIRSMNERERCTSCNTICLHIGCTSVHLALPSAFALSALRPTGLAFPSFIIMITDDLQTRPTFTSSITIDCSRGKLLSYAETSNTTQKKFDSHSLLQWVRSLPSPDDVHVYLGNVSFHGQRVLLRQLQAMGCTVTCRQYKS